MYQNEKRKPFVIILIFCFIGLVSSCSPGILERATHMAKNAGVDKAGEQCSELKFDDNGLCGSSVLECNKVKVETNDPLGNWNKTCQVKSWIVSLSLSLIILIPIAILASICYFCLKHHCFSRISWWLKDRKCAA